MRDEYNRRSAPKKPGSMAGQVLPAKMPERKAAPLRTSDKDFIPSSPLKMREGQRVEHNRFGYGKILRISRDPGQMKAVIDFDDLGEKTLLLGYAKLRIVE